MSGHDPHDQPAVDDAPGQVHGHDEHGHSLGGGGHQNPPASFGKTFTIGITVNVAYMAAQVFYGLAANSVALLANAVHSLSGVLGLMMAWAAMRPARRPTQTRTYGRGRSTILTNAAVLLLGCGAIVIEAGRRFALPQPIAAGIVIWVAAAGIGINGVTALMFISGRTNNLINSAFLRMAAAATVSYGVLLAALAIQSTGWLWLDPVTSLDIVVVIVVGTWGLLFNSVNQAMGAIPSGIILAEVEDVLLALPGVGEVHDVHIWAPGTAETALTAHLIQSTPGNKISLIAEARAAIRNRFKIDQSTFQVETKESADACALRTTHGSKLMEGKLQHK